MKRTLKKLVQPRTRWKNDNFLGWVVGVVFLAGFCCMVAGKFKVQYLRLDSEKCYTAAGALFILTGTLWLACAVLLSKKTKKVLNNPFHAIVCRDPVMEFVEEVKRGALLSRGLHKNEGSLWSRIGGAMIALGILGERGGLQSGHHASTSLLLDGLATRIRALERQVEMIEQTRLDFDVERAQKTQQQMRVMDQMQEKIQALSEAVSDAANNVMMGSLYIIAGTLLLMVEVFWQNHGVRDYACRFDDPKCSVFEMHEKGPAKEKGR